MSDNTVLNTGSGGDTLRDVDKSGIKTPVVILDIGGTGTESLYTGIANAVVDDASEQYVAGSTKPLSLTNDGYLRVMNRSESYNMSAWGDPEKYATNYNQGTLSAW